MRFYIDDMILLKHIICCNVKIKYAFIILNALYAVPLEEKLKPDHEVRFPEEEGLYIGNRLTVAVRNKNKLEQRLVAAGDRYTLLPSFVKELILRESNTFILFHILLALSVYFH